MSRRFNGSTDRINCGSPAVLDNLTSGFTFSGWIYATGSGANAKGYVFSKGADVTFTDDTAMLIRIVNPATPTASDFALRFSVGYNDGFPLFKDTANATFQYNTWYHLIVTWDSSNFTSAIRIYKDGVEVSYGSSGTHSGGATHNDAAGNFIIGDRDGASNRTWQGDLFDVRVFDSVVNGGNFIFLRTNVAVGNEVGLWTLAGSASPEPDSSGNGNDGVLTGTTGTSNPPAIGTNHVQQTIPGVAKIHATLTKTITGKANIFPAGRSTRIITGVAAISPGLTSGEWTALPAPTQVPYADLTGVYDPRGWDKLEYDPTSGKFWTWDGYLATDRPYTIYGNALWQYDQGSNKLILYKIINWKGTGVGYQTAVTPENTADPTPYDRHSYQHFCVVPTTNKLYMWGGANSTKTDSSEWPNWWGDLWSYNLSATPGTPSSWAHISYNSAGATPSVSDGSISSPTLPYTSYEQAMVWDTQNSKIILFSARNDHAFVTEGRDTYTYDPATDVWTNKANATGDPTAKMGQSLCWDSTRNCVWMFGGSGAAPYPQLGNELWKYVPATNTWSQPTTTGTTPAARRFGSWAYDSLNDVCILFGGNDNASGLNDTWAFRPSALSWTQLAPAVKPTASAATGNKLAYDSVNNYFVYNAMASEGKFYLFRFGTTTHTDQTITGKAKIKAHVPKTITGVANIAAPTGRHQQTITGVANIAPGPMSIALTVNETLVGTVSGRARSLGPVSAGIPIPESANITSVSQLGMTGPTAYQFRILGNYASGKAKWVLCDFQSSVSAGGTASATLTTGSGPVGTNMATDGSTISIDTGAAVFQVIKAPFRILDSVTVGGVSVVSTGGNGVSVLLGGNIYCSANDNACTTTIEENGPVRVCVKSEGILKFSGTRLMDYTCRTHFYKGKSYCRVYVTLRNANESFTTAPTFDSSELSFRLASSASTFVTKTSLDLSDLSVSLSAAETAYGYQAYSTKWGYPGNNYPLAPMNTSVLGVRVTKGATDYHAQSNSAADYFHGWASLEDSGGKGVTMVMPFMAQYWPAGFEVAQDGQFSVQLFSKRNSRTGIKFAWGAHETREVLLDFHTSAPSSRDTALYEAQYPLSARAAISQYNSCGAILEETQLVTQAEINTWYTTKALAPAPTLANFEPVIHRYWSWPQPSGNNQLDFAQCDLIDWLRTGNGGFYHEGLRQTHYKSDQAVRHSDGYDYYLDQFDAGNDGEKTNINSFNGQIFDFEHTHWRSLVVAYYLTGQEHFKTSIYDFAEWKLAMADGVAPLYYNSLNLYGDGEQRLWTRYMWDFATCYDFIRDPVGTRYWNAAMKMANDLLTVTEVGPSDPTTTGTGRNRSRGYVFFQYESSGDPYTYRGISDFILMQIHFEACYYILLLMRQLGHSYTNSMEDYLLGLVDFIYNEFYFEYGPNIPNYGTPYFYMLDIKNDATTNSVIAQEGFRNTTQARPMTFGYQMTGDTKYLDRARKVMFGDSTPSDSNSHAFMYNDLYRPETGWHTINKLSVNSLGGGSYRLSWTTPTSATAYRIRYASDKTVVDWLGFSQMTRTYTYDPSGAVPWFNATHYGSPPTPQAGGTVQVVTINGLDQNTIQYFMVKYTTGVTPVSTPRTIQGKAKILAHVPQTITGKSRILKHVPQTITGVASILPPSTTRAVHDITGVANIATGPGPSTWTHGTTPYGQWKKGR